MDEIASIEEPGRENISGIKGSSFRALYVLRDQFNIPISLAGFSGTASVRPAPGSQIVTTFAVTVSQSPSGASDTGEVLVEAPASTTIRLPDSGVWCLELSDGVSIDKVILEGSACFRLK